MCVIQARGSEEDVINACTLFINSLVHLQLTKTETARDSSDNETDHLVQLTSIMRLQIIPLYRSLFSWFQSLPGRYVCM